MYDDLVNCESTSNTLRYYQKDRKNYFQLPLLDGEGGGYRAIFQILKGPNISTFHCTCNVFSMVPNTFAAA